MNKRNIILHQVFSDVAWSAVQNMEESTTNDDKLILSIDRFYDKRKQTKLNPSDLIDVEKKYFKLMGEIRDYEKEKEHSLNIMVFVFLDYMLNTERDTEIRVKFGHIDTRKLLDTYERSHMEIVLNGYKLIRDVIE